MVEVCCCWSPAMTGGGEVERTARMPDPPYARGDWGLEKAGVTIAGGIAIGSAGRGELGLAVWLLPACVEQREEKGLKNKEMGRKRKKHGTIHEGGGEGLVNVQEFGIEHQKQRARTHHHHGHIACQSIRHTCIDRIAGEGTKREKHTNDIGGGGGQIDECQQQNADAANDNGVVGCPSQRLRFAERGGHHPCLVGQIRQSDLRVSKNRKAFHNR